MSAYRVRVCDVVSTVWRANSPPVTVDSVDLAAEFANSYRSSDPQLPVPAARRVFAQGQVAARSGTAGSGEHRGAGDAPNLDVDLGGVVRAEVLLFSLPVPVGEIVATILLDLETDEIGPGSPLSNVFGSCADGRLLLDGRPVADVVEELALLLLAQAVDRTADAVEPERHTLALVRGDGAAVPAEPVVAGLVYGRHVPMRPEFRTLQRPASLNRAEGEYAAVSRHATFLYAQPSEVENSVLLTTVQAVATSARLRQIWYDAQHSASAFQSERQKTAVGVQMRDDLEWLADTIGNLEFDLAVNVEASADVGLGSATARIEDFHHDLYEAMRIPQRSRAVGQTFTRLRSGLEVELIAIDTRERANATLSIETIAALLSVVGLPIFFILAYLGVNAREVDGDVSMFSLRYWPVYTFAASLSLLAILLMFPRLRTLRRRRF